MRTELRLASRLRALASSGRAVQIAALIQHARGQLPVERAGGLELGALGNESARQASLPCPQRRFHQCEVQQVALRMAATESMGARADRQQQVDGLRGLSRNE